ncbi:ABC transporter ATP-binding protein [Geobacillus thermocatenulatus]|uniref:ATPase n=1 Tax=Geobacillus thermocatenulatus TaxID=33938 RepID=A0A226QAG8_9BACL|nr:ATP-binding cassette domain-containing protein [Geobacillus thermocatenulatus]ASS99344.1 ATPase [Geobacillus thermocatenulatus]KPC97288.1 putative ABC transporter ATP-binding protein YxlF [Geobacillus sp. BCO2]OXB88888.1 ATPase [Geobacillus thermocatenulatus]
MTSFSDYAIEASGIEKTLRGTLVLKGINLSVSYGEIVAIVGANGSGKSLLFRILAGLVYPDKGKITIGGKPLQPGLLGPLADIGLLIETPGFLPYLSGMDNLRLLAMLRRRITDEEIAETMRKVGLEPTDRRPVKAYSLGMRQRLGIAQAIMERQKILLLDEPTNALDPEFTDDFLKMLSDLRNNQFAIVMTSHDLHEVKGLADRILLMKNGILTNYEI